MIIGISRAHGSNEVHVTVLTKENNPTTEAMEVLADGPLLPTRMFTDGKRSVVAWSRHDPVLPPTMWLEGTDDPLFGVVFVTAVDNDDDIPATPLPLTDAEHERVIDALVHPFGGLMRNDGPGDMEGFPLIAFSDTPDFSAIPAPVCGGFALAAGFQLSLMN